MENKNELRRIKRHKRIVVKITGTAERPRVVVHRSLKNFSAQAVDDVGKKDVLPFYSGQAGQGEVAPGR